MVHNERAASVAAILQWTLFSCIALCSVDLFCSVVKHGCGFEFYDDGGCGKSLCKRRSRLFSIQCGAVQCG